MDMVEDPANPQWIYAVFTNGVAFSSDGGMHWSDVSANLPPLLFPTPPYLAQVAIGQDPNAQGGNRVFILGEAGAPSGGWAVFYADPGPQWSWTQLGPLPAQSFPTGGLVVHPSNSNLVYIGSDRNNEYVGDLTTNPTTWTSLKVNGSAHADTRELRFSAGPNPLLLEADDGGVYRLHNPFTPNNSSWDYGGGNMQITEFYSIAYDSLNRFLFGAAQDNGVPSQTMARPKGSDPVSFDWTQDNGGNDGICVGVDNQAPCDSKATCNNVQNISSRHYSSEFPGFLDTWAYDNWANGQQTHASAPIKGDVAVPGMSLDMLSLELNLLDAQRKPKPTSLYGGQTWAINRHDPKRMVLGTNYMYETNNSASSTRLSP